METKRKWTKTEDYEAIVLKNLYGMTYEKIAEELKVSVETVRRVIKAQEIVKDQNWEEAVRIISTGQRINHLKYFAEKMGLEIPAEVQNAYDSYQAEKDKPAKKTAKAVEPEKKEQQNETLYLCKILENQAKTIELFNQLLETVIPHWTVDIEKNLNANADIISERQKKIEEKVEKIVYNTKRRGA